MPADPSDPRAWLERARSNLLLAEKGKRKGVMLEDLCFNSQQAAEKALKAVCLHHHLDFPKTHSISRLLDILEAAGIKIPKQVQTADVLTQYAIQTRYPGPVEEITIEEYEESLAISARVVFWAGTVILGGNEDR
jgi:HEPN domain-containing protein